jgi:uncharacterized protein YfkK (UPF0435 family)
MNVAYVSALAALGGSVVGGLISGVATWLAQRSQIQAGRSAHQISYHEELFRDFIVGASKAYAHAMMNNQPDLQELIGVYSLINRMQVLCSPETTACAQRVVDMTIETYFQPNKTFNDIHAMIKERTLINPLSEFAAAAREELRTLDSR